MRCAEHDNDLDGRPIALIVGGTSGLGLPIVHALANRGYSIATVGRSAAPACAFAHYICDLRDTSAWQATLNQIRASLPRIAVAGFVAGYAHAVRPELTSVEDRFIHYRLNADYVADAYQTLFQLLQPAAKVFTIGSQWTFRRGCEWLLPYMMAKQALLAITHEFYCLPQMPQVRHYCVPTMDTPAFHVVRNSFRHLGLQKEFADLRFENSAISPREVANALITHLMEIKEDRLTWRINPQLAIDEISLENAKAP